MTFWEQFYNLCKTNNSKPNPVGEKLGISSATITRWKKGQMPSPAALEKLTSFFDCSTDYLLGKTSIKKQAADEQPVSDEMKKLIEVSSSLSPDNLLLLQKLAETLVDRQNQEES